MVHPGAAKIGLGLVDEFAIEFGVESCVVDSQLWAGRDEGGLRPGRASSTGKPASGSRTNAVAGLTPFLMVGVMKPSV